MKTLNKINIKTVIMLILCALATLFLILYIYNNAIGSFNDTFRERVSRYNSTHGNKISISLLEKAAPVIPISVKLYI